MSFIQFGRRAISVALLVLPLAGGGVQLAAQRTVTTSVMVPMRDGVRLATNVVLPAKDGVALPGPFPAILSRTPYGRGGGHFFAARGYAFVSQDVRGRGDSEGTFYIYVNEGEDGYDAVKWLAEQPWCDGNIGTYGGSYLSATQHALAALNPPNLKAMFATVGTANYIRDGAGRGGAFALLHNLAYALYLAETGKEARKDARVAAAIEADALNIQQLFWESPFPPEESPFLPAPSYNAWYADWWKHSTYGEYWKQNGYNFEERYSGYADDVAIYNIGGWYDIFKRGTLRNFTGLSHRKGPTKLLMGPWTHGLGGRVAGDVDYGDGASVSIRLQALAWFDRFLKGVDNGIDREPRVKYFVMGGTAPAALVDGYLRSGGEWKTADDWPPPGNTELKLYLRGDGRLGREAPVDRSTSEYRYDPSNPVPTLGGNIDSGARVVYTGPPRQVIPAGYFAAKDRTPLTERADILTFQTDPLERDIEATGPMSVTLWVSSTAVDTDFTAKLVDVYPPSEQFPEGYAVNIEDGILRMRFRESPEREEFMVPGEIYKVTIDLWATSNRFRQGHRIRLDISSSNFPMFDLNPNTGEPMGRHERVEAATNTVYHGPARPSSLNLTTLPAPRR